ncbi:MAG TPA: FAD/NAD(P)-binding oxidoreductase [Burkholderiaceae bacterium]|nr:FAD/NAD(P)-binding oxidoreductase [Burkholderiaceae bacterium]HQR72490.1 FAD/NAD(P)-binding oxidoreductase [Burkholderiaceae bacterium]
MTTNVVVLGDGTGGMVAANLLARESRRKNLPLRIVLIGKSPVHTYQPGMLFLPFRTPGYKTLADIQRPNADFVGPGVEYLCENIEAVDPQARSVTTDKGQHTYDWLILALGCRTVIEDIDGLPQRWGKQAHGFYTPDSALRLAGALEQFKGGDLVIDIAEMPIKCPVAPLEFACLVDEYLTRRGLRSKTELTLVTPLSGAFTKPICNEMLTGMLQQKGVKVVPDASLAAVSDDAVICPDGKKVHYDLLVTIPPHEGSELIDDAGLGDGLGFGLTDRGTLKAKKAERIFLLGDNTNVPTSKAGSVAHFQAEVVVHNVLREIEGREAQPLADGHANCFIETGFGKAILIDFNYDIQPVPGSFPLPILGPMSLLKETRLNHLGKLAFRPIYWNMLLPGRPIPLVGSRMSTSGKKMDVLSRSH